MIPTGSASHIHATKPSVAVTARNAAIRISHPAYTPNRAPPCSGRDDESSVSNEGPTNGRKRRYNSTSEREARIPKRLTISLKVFERIGEKFNPDKRFTLHSTRLGNQYIDYLKKKSMARENGESGKAVSEAASDVTVADTNQASLSSSSSSGNLSENPKDGAAGKDQNESGDTTCPATPV